MAGFLNVSSVLMCPHGGSVQAITSNTRVKAAGDFLVLQSDTFTIVGCLFTLPPAEPHPCVQVQWVAAAERSQAISSATLTEGSSGLCAAADQTVQGAVLIVSTQPQVTGS
jgi:hypothetical protein